MELTDETKKALGVELEQNIESMDENDQNTFLQIMVKVSRTFKKDAHAKGVLLYQEDDTQVMGLNVAWAEAAHLTIHTAANFVRTAEDLEQARGEAH